MTVYFIQAGEDGPIKIGYTSGHAVNRIRELQTSSPYVLRVLGEVFGGIEREALVHAHLAAHRIRGEWFQNVADVHALLKELIEGTFTPVVKVSRRPKHSISQPATVTSQPALHVCLPGDLADVIRGAARIADVDPSDLVIDALRDTFACIEKLVMVDAGFRRKANRSAA